MSELKADCKARIEKVHEKVDAAKKAKELCADDFLKLCQGVPYVEPTRTACLKKHKAKLSEACAKTLQ
jgi:hypothetical protein